jgi:O-antigen ligase
MNSKKLVERAVEFQPLFAVPIYFSVLVGNPTIWASLFIGIIPLGMRYWLTNGIIRRTPFDVPILLFSLGMLVGFVVAPDKSVSLGALCSTLASVLVYYGIVSNSEKGSQYWLWVAGTICIITLLMSVWFFSQGNGRHLFFNEWVFKLFEVLPGTGISLQMHSLGALLSVVLPPLLAIAIFMNKNSRLRLATSALTIVLFAILFLSDSGTGWIATICGVAVALLCWRKSMAGIVIPVTGLITLAIVVFYGKAQWLSQSLSVTHFLDRVGLWRQTIPLLTGNHMVTGIGLGSWYKIYDCLYHENQLHLHSNYLQLYTDTGLLGGAALIAAVVIFTRLSFNVLKTPGQDLWRGAGIGLMGAIIAGAIFACLDVTTTATVVTVTSYIYLSVPLIWIWAALFVVTFDHLGK